MRTVAYLTRRHMMLFLKNKLNILLSFASIFIILGIYVLFLRDFMLDIVEKQGVLPSLAPVFTDHFMVAGLIVVISTTTCFGMIQIAVNDAASGVRRDYLVSPASPFQIALGYLLSGTLVSSFFTCLSAMGCALYFSARYSSAPTLREMLRICGAVVYSCCLNSMILLCLTRFLRSTATFSTLANLYGTLIGFLAGAYLPCYFYPAALRRVLFYFPPAQMTSVLRQMFTKHLNGRLGSGLPGAYLEQLQSAFGIRLERGGSLCTPEGQWQILAISGLLLLGGIFLLNREPIRFLGPKQRKKALVSLSKKGRK